MSELDLAQRALSFTRGEAQATVTRERSLFSRFALSRPTQATRVDDVSVAILRVHEGHTGSAETNDASDAGLRDVAAQAEAAARSAAAAAPEPGDYPGLPAPAVPAAHAGYDAATALLDPAASGAALQTAFDGCAAHGTEAFGLWTAGLVDTAIASSTGVAVADSCTDTFMKVIARDRDGRSGWATGAGSAIADLDAAALTERAAAKVTRAEPVALAPGEYPVVLEADAVGTLLDFLGAMAFNGLAHAEGRGALVGRLGERVAAPGIDLSDSPRHPRTLPRAFDAEAVAKAPLALIEDGVARAVVHDRRSAARAGAGSTGHALTPGGSPTDRTRRTSCSPAARPRRRPSWRRRSSAGSTSRASGTSIRRREVDVADRHHARRHLPHRGRPCDPAAARPALHRLRAAPAHGRRGARRRPAPGLRGRLLRAPLRLGRRVPAAAGPGLPGHRAHGLTSRGGGETSFLPTYVWA